MKTWIIYFSRAHQNWVDGEVKDLAEGNTKKAADIIKEETDGEEFEIRMVHPYSEDYIPCTEEAHQDQLTDKRPEIVTPLPSIEDGDTVYLGYPIYWDLMPMAVLTFLESYSSWKNVTIYPFVTHEGSGLGASISMLKRKTPDANVTSPLPIPGSLVERCKPLIVEWINGHNKK